MCLVFLFPYRIPSFLVRSDPLTSSEAFKKTAVGALSDYKSTPLCLGKREINYDKPLLCGVIRKGEHWKEGGHFIGTHVEAMCHCTPYQQVPYLTIAPNDP